ncbi:MAG TPA: AI-2E family transporter [Acidimicrobiia bacterium]|jgi:predicted PurR-regulated permease PerM
MQPEPRAERSADRIPIRRYAAFWGIGVAIVGGVWLAWSLVNALLTVLALLAVAGFFAVVLTPAVDLLERRTRMRRGLATLAVFVVGVIVFGALAYAFARPVYDSSSTFAKDLPHTIRDAEHGRGQVGHWLKDIGAQKWAHDNLPKLRKSLTDTNGPLLSAGKTVLTGVVAFVTILVLTFLLLLEGPSISAFFFDLLPERRAERIRRVGADAARAVTGYMAGNLLISLIAGVAIYIWLRAFFLPFALVLALWVAFADMLPLVGATVGAIPAVFVALLDSPGTGIATLGFFVVYQQFENHVLQTTVMSKTVKLNPLGVLLAVLAGVELAGLLGALLAIPLAGAIQVVTRDVWSERRGRVKEVLSLGTSEAPTEPEPPGPDLGDPPDGGTASGTD